MGKIIYSFSNYSNALNQKSGVIDMILPRKSNDYYSIIVKPFIIIVSGLLFIFHSTGFSQDENRLKIEKCARLQGGMLTQFNNEEHTISPGIDLQYCYGIKTGKRFGAGLGAGFQYFNKESFVPVLIDLLCFIGHNQKSSFIYLNGGYSLAWSEKYKDYMNHDFSGGPALGFGYGKKICIKDQYEFFINAGYHYQNAVLKYESDNEKSECKGIHYHMIVINVGLMLEQ